MSAKSRLDTAMVDRGLAQSRQKAQGYILAGQVFVDGERVDKVAHPVQEDSEVSVRGAVIPFVSRGGLKLDKALSVFPIDVTDKVAIDVGASTGGFTDCLLQNGAKRVYAVDVGYGQLDWTLRNDPRVVVMERCNARNMQASMFDVQPDFAGMDVSFISIRKIFPALHEVLVEGSEVVALIKPQFEAGREFVGKNGVVRDASVHQDVIERALQASRETGFSPLGLDYSPVTGPKGNVEFLLYMARDRKPAWEANEDHERAYHWAQEAAKHFSKQGPA